MVNKDSCGHLIKQIHGALEKSANNALRSNDMTMAQVDALMLLNDSPEKQMSLKQMEQLMHVAQSTAAGIIVRLEQKGLIESFGDPGDKRVKMIRITSQGEARCIQSEQHMAQAESRLLSALTDTEKDIFRALLKKVGDSRL